MTETISGYKCQNCKKALRPDEKPCPNCGCGLRNINVVVSDQIKVRTALGMKKFGQNSKKFLTHLKQGWFPSGDITKHADGVQLTQSVDRENNLYTKKVIDEKTGEVVKDLEEPLDQHISSRDSKS